MIHSEIVIDQHFGGLNPMQFGHEKCEPGHFFGPAVRTHWLLHYVISGFGTYEIHGITHQIVPGDLFVIPPYIETYYEASKEHPWNYVWIGFTTQDTLPDFFSKPVIHCPNAGIAFEDMLLCKNMENGRSAYLAGCLWKLVSILLEQEHPSSDHIDKALHYMRAEYANNISVSDIAQRLNLDRCYFSTLFTRRTGQSPKEYLINLRLTKAIDLMLLHGESPSTAALSVGYTDLYQFSKIFKQKYGMSPRAYIAHYHSSEKGIHS